MKKKVLDIHQKISLNLKESEQVKPGTRLIDSWAGKGTQYKQTCADNRTLQAT